MSLHCLTLLHTLQVFLNSVLQITSFLSQRKAGSNIITMLWHLHGGPCTCPGGSSHILGIIILYLRIYILGIITLIISLHQTNYISVCQIPQSQLQTLGECEIPSSGRLNSNGNCFNLTKENTEEFPRTLAAYTHINHN